MNRFLALNRTKRVIVGMSGGVDSSVAAYLLKLQGYDVVGLHMVNWDHREERDDTFPLSSTSSSSSTLECFEKDYDDVQKLCRALDIQCYQTNFVKDYWSDVFAPTLEGIKAKRNFLLLLLWNVLFVKPILLPSRYD